MLELLLVADSIMSQQKHSEPPLQITATRSDRPQHARCSVTPAVSHLAVVKGWLAPESLTNKVIASALHIVTHLVFPEPLHPLSA